ncbi:MAG: hypothetical protein IJG40_03210 [Oscillospiraceae bacterium]|nr:hypothetical protein [Oscillospiraceae bacterium]
MKKMITVLLVSLMFVILFSSAAFAEEFDPAAEAPQDTQVGWGVFSLPADLKPESYAPSGSFDPTDNSPAPSTDGFCPPDTIKNDYPTVSSKSSEDIEKEIFDRISEYGPVPLISTCPIPYIPIGEIDTNY